MAKNITKGKIGNALTSTANDHVVAVANDIYDEEYEKYQSEINQYLSEHISLNVFAVEMDKDTGDLIAITEEDGNVTNAGITDDGDIYADWEFD